MTKVIIAHEKHGTLVYASARALLSRRIKDGYWYYDADAVEAKKAFAAGEDAAWAFLCKRSEHEYEDIDAMDVIE